MSSEALLEQRDAIRNLLSKRPKGSRKKFPNKLRTQIIDYAHRRLAVGETREAVCRDLGLSPTSLWRFLGAGSEPQSKVDEAEDVSTAMRPVRVVPEASESSLLVMRGPGGIAVEGLSLGAVVSILRSLSCSV